MADVADDAGVLAEHHHAAALKHLRDEQARLERIAQSTAPAQPGDERDCRDCGNEIAPERLAVLPRSVRCVRCGEIAEQHYRDQAWRRP